MERPRAEPASADDTRPLRLAVLRPGMDPASVTWDIDDDPRCAHFACRESGEIVGVVSILPQPRPGSTDIGEWQFRGMATSPAVRGKGYGQAVLAAAIDHATANGATVIWCNARLTAIGFYEKAGFHGEGSEFMVKGVGPHRQMSQAVAPKPFQKS